MNLFLFVVIFIITYILFRNNDRKRKINSKLPGPIGLPVLGNLLSMKGDVHLKLKEWYEKYGTVYYIRMGSIDTVVLTEYPTIRKAFIENSSVFENIYQYPSRIQASGWENIGQENGEIHAILKKVILSEMTATRIKKMEYHIVEESEKLIKLFDQHAEDGNPFVINDYITMFSLNIAFRFIFGINYPYKQVDDSKGLVYAVKRLISVAGNPILGDFIPILRTNKNVFVENYALLLTESEILVKKFQEDQAKKSKNDNENESILSKLIKEFEEGNITWGNVLNTCIDLIAAGSDTSSNTLVFCLIEMINNLEIQKKLFDNIITSTKDEDTVISHSKYRSSILFLSMVVKESYRKYPAVPIGVPHITTEDVKIGNLTIAAGTQIIQNIYASHRSEKQYPSPNEFLPERFIENNQNSNLLLFGIGVRDCVGRSLAEAEIFTIVGTLIKRYEFINPTSTPLCDIGKFGLAYEPAQTKAIIKRRKQIN